MPVSLVELGLGRHRLTPADQLVIEPDEFESKFTRPKSRVRVPLAKLQGRCGDMIVFQLRGGSHAPHNQQASLRSLGLGSFHDASLRWSDDDVTAGYLRSVRHLIGVAKLNLPCYKEWLSPGYETQQFGTPSRPGQVWRALTGQYLGYHADRSGVAMYMSSAHTLSDVLPRIQLSPIAMEPDGASAETWVSLHQASGGWTSRRGHFASVMDGLSLAEVHQASIPLKSIGRVSVDTVFLTLTWEARVKKFHDIDRVSHEIGLLAAKEFAGSCSAFRDMFSEMGSREEVPMAMSILNGGRRVEVVI